MTNERGQHSTDSAVLAIGQISKSVDEMNEISLTIATAVEEQTATTNEVSRIVATSSSAVEDISKTIKDGFAFRNAKCNRCLAVIRCIKKFKSIGSAIKRVG